MRIQQQQPSEQSIAGDFARQLLTVQGPAIQAPDNSHAAAEYLALGGALAAARQTTVSSLDEAFANTATRMLGELEASYGLTPRPDLSLDARRTRLLAKIRAARRGSPQGILKAVRVYDPTATMVEVQPSDISVRTADGVYPGSDRDVYHFTILVSSAVYNDTEKRSQIAAICEQMKEAHCSFLITTAIGFFADISQADVGVLGA